MIRKKNVSTSFAVFLNTFLIVSTVIVFAVLLFLSYENTINSLLANSISHTETTCEGISDDILKIYNNMDDSNAADLSSYLDIYMGSETLRNVGNVYIVIDDGTILYSNNMDVRGNKIVDEHSIEAINGSTTELDTKTSKTSQTIFVRTIKRIGDTGMVCFVEYEASVTDAREDYIRVVLMPALISMLVAIALFVGFIGLTMKPIKEISRVISMASEGDFSGRVSRKVTDYHDINSITVSSDLSEMARTVNMMLEQLDNQEKDRQIFISSVAHDLRTPLTSINGFITAMLDGTIPQEQYEKYLSKIKQEVDRIRKLIVTMTEASSLSHIDPDLMEEFDIKDVIEDIISNLEPQLRTKNIDAESDIKDGNHMCYGEAQQLCRVIVNIVTNAIKFTPDGGKIKITAFPDDRQRKVFISVEDSGPGVEPEKRNRVFESFYKADPSRKQEGFGLGLYICKQILAGHDQTITLDESKELGGARFNFSFPYPPEKMS